MNRKKISSRSARIAGVLATLASTVGAAPIPPVDIAPGPLLACRGSAAGGALMRPPPGPVSVTSMTASPEGMFAYQAGFNVPRWSGSLKKLPVLFAQDGVASVGAAPVWDASTLLTGADGKAANPPPAMRRIHTAKAASGKTLAAIPFSWDQLTPEQRAALDMSPASGKADGLGQKRLNYLRGERDLEQGRPQGVFRTRDSVLGDIVHSVAVYAGPPAGGVTDDAYRKFQAAYQHRAKAVYVGANDGMLHAFNADSGEELFAYIPSVLVAALGKLTAPEYVHKPYVDSTVAVGDALIGKKWKTVLAGGTGGGAQGVYVLDVTDPADFSGGNGVIFEFTDSDDPDIGNVIGVPQIAKFKTGTIKGVPEYKYFVIVPSGLNNYKDDGKKTFDAAAPGALFLLSLDKEPSVKWQSGVNYYKLKTPIADIGLPNGLFSPAVVVNGDGAARFLYAGDFQGNLWRLDFSGDAPWSGALGKTPYKPLFIAQDDKGGRQPITARPRVVFAPGGGYLVLFGTGKFLEHADTDPAHFERQSFYAVYDNGETGYKVQRGELMPRTLRAVPASEGNMFEISGGAFVYGNAAAARKGWYFDFPDSQKAGERMIAEAAVMNGKLFFNTLMPDREPCGPGSARFYVVDVLTGLPPGGHLTGLSSDGAQLGPTVLIQGKAEIGDRSPVGRRTVKRKTTVLNGAVNDGRGAPSAGGPVIESTSTAGRLSWREIVNWQELRDAAKKQ